MLSGYADNHVRQLQPIASAKWLDELAAPSSPGSPDSSKK
jgi:hypothetical protein